MEEILKNKGKVIFLGNEAIVRASLEAGVQFATTYPGAPSSEIGDIFYKIQNSKFKIQNLYFEYSVNEKVVLEAGIGASFAGLKTLVVMKHFGLNVCSDALLPFLYTGSNGSMVIIVGDDPSCHSSAQSEQNSRFYSYLFHLPTLEPASPQEAKDFTKLAFELSEKFKIPILIRTTTRVAHQRELVKLENLKLNKFKPNFDIKEFKKTSSEKFAAMPSRILEMKKKLLAKISNIQEFSENSSINKVENCASIPRYKRKQTKKLGIITTGISYLHAREVLKEINLSLPILKLGFFYPLPEKKIKNFIKNFKKVLVVEELEPCLEKEIQRLAKDVNPGLEIIGKKLLPEIGELNHDQIIAAIAKLLNKKYKKLEIENYLSASPCEAKRAGQLKEKLEIRNWELEIPKRYPQLCPGCPYWFVFSAIKKAVKPQEVIFGGDIGCYMLAGFPPHFLQDYLSCMGSSIGIAHGIKKSTNGQKLIAFIGDATFFHAGIPALINVVRNQSNPLIILMDNQTTAMTGQQPHLGIKSDNLPIIKIEEIIRACGVKNLKIIDPIKIKEMVKTIRVFLKKKEPSLIIARRPCVRLN